MDEIKNQMPEDKNKVASQEFKEVDYLHWKKKQFGTDIFPFYGNALNGFRGRRYTTCVAPWTTYAIYTFGGASTGAMYKLHILNRKTRDLIELCHKEQWGYSTLAEAKEAAQEYEETYGYAGLNPADFPDEHPPKVNGKAARVYTP